MLGSVFALGWSWGGLARSWGGLGAVLGRSWGALGFSLGAVLGRLEASWSGLGAAGGPKNLDFPYVFQCFCKIDVLSKHGHLGRSWAFLGTAWADLGPS